MLQSAWPSIRATQIGDSPADNIQLANVCLHWRGDRYGTPDCSHAVAQTARSGLGSVHGATRAVWCGPPCPWWAGFWNTSRPMSWVSARWRLSASSAGGSSLMSRRPDLVFGAFRRLPRRARAILAVALSRSTVQVSLLHHSRQHRPGPGIAGHLTAILSLRFTTYRVETRIPLDRAGG